MGTKDRFLTIIVAILVISMLAILFGVQVFYAFTQREYVTEPNLGRQIEGEEYLFGHGNVIISVESLTLPVSDTDSSPVSSPPPTSSLLNEVIVLLNGKSYSRLVEGENVIKVNEGDFLEIQNRQEKIRVKISCEDVEIVGKKENFEIGYGITPIGRVK